MSFDKPSNSDDDDPGRQYERRPFNTDLSIDSDEFSPDDYIPFTRAEASDDARDPDAAGKPELGSREWFEAKADLWERRGAGEDVEIPGWNIPFTRDDVREWAHSPNGDIPAPGTPVWEAWKADRADRDRPAAIGDPDKPKPLQAEASNGNGEGTRTTEKTESTDKPETADGDAERVEKLESELSEAKAERSKLIDTVSRQADKIDRQDAKIEKQGSENDKLRSENDRLKARVAELEKNEKTDKGTDTGDSPAAKQTDAGSQDRFMDTPKRSRQMHLPSGEAAGIFTAVVTTGDAAGKAGHVLTNSETGIIGAGAGLLVAGYLWGKSKYEEKKHGHRPQN